MESTTTLLIREKPMPVVLVGRRMCGVVDHVPGLFHVVTAFFHINNVPIVPEQSYLVFADGRTGRSVRLWPKSVLVGYVRSWLMAACVLLTLVGGNLGGICGMVVAMSGYLGPAVIDPSNHAPPAADVAFVGGVAVGVVLAVALIGGLFCVLTERPQPAGRNPATFRLLWHVLLAAFVAALAASVFFGAQAVRGAVAGRPADALDTLPNIASGCLAATVLLSFVYRLTLFQTLASHERALQVAADLGFPREIVEEHYRNEVKKQQPLDRQP
jgi:hypothetical protein